MTEKKKQLLWNGAYGKKQHYATGNAHFETITGYYKTDNDRFFTDTIDLSIITYHERDNEAVRMSLMLAGVNPFRWTRNKHHALKIANYPNLYELLDELTRHYRKSKTTPWDEFIKPKGYDFFEEYKTALVATQKAWHDSAEARAEAQHKASAVYKGGWDNTPPFDAPDKT